MPTRTPVPVGHRASMKGVVLAAGRGSRLGDLTAHRPKALLEVADGCTILDVVLANLRSVGVDQVAIVVGFAAAEIAARTGSLSTRHDVTVTLIENDRAEEWNNAYSLWLATAWMTGDTMVVNGDTVHPAAMEQRLLAVEDPGGILVAVDTLKRLGAEEMKVVLGDGGEVLVISKEIAPETAAGEYPGVALVRSAAVDDLRSALEVTWHEDPSRFYEDGFQALADAGYRIGAVPVGAMEWIEVDTPADLERARELACRC